MRYSKFKETVLRHRSRIKGVYKECFRIDPELALYEIAQQANSNKSCKDGAIKVVGPKLVKLALELFPKARVGDTFQRKWPIR